MLGALLLDSALKIKSAALAENHLLVSVADTGHRLLWLPLFLWPPQPRLLLERLLLLRVAADVVVVVIGGGHAQAKLPSLGGEAVLISVHFLLLSGIPL